MIATETMSVYPISTHKSAEKEKPKEETKRYPTRDRKPPQHLGEYDEEHQEYHSTSTCFVHHVYKCVSGIPNTYEEAINSPDAMEWINAMEDEINSLRETNTFDLVERPDQKVIPCRWVFAKKNDGSTNPGL